MGGTIGDVSFELRCIWIQAAVYFCVACLVYGHQLRTSRLHAQERLEFLRKKRIVRKQLSTYRKPLA